MLVGFVTEWAGLTGQPIADPWAVINQAVGATPATDLQINLAFFDGQVGAITQIRSGDLGIGPLFRAAFNQMATSYFNAALALDPAQSWSRIVLTGGVMHKSEHLRLTIAERFGMEPEVSFVAEDTLRGLGNLVANSKLIHP